MSGLPGLSSRQRDLVAASRAAAGRSRQGLEEAGLRSAEPGDVFVLAATAGWPIEWVLVDRPRPDGPFLAVPGDSMPFLGAGDLATATSSGPLNLRCRFAVWLDPKALEADRRVAMLLPEHLDRARESVDALTRSADEIAPELLRADDPADYAGWLREVVAPARSALRGPAKPLAFPPLAALARKPAFVPWEAAAALLLATSLALAGWGFFEARRGDRLAARELGLLAANRDAEARLRQESAAAAELRTRSRGLGAEPTTGERPLLDLPVAILLPDEALRSDEAPPAFPIDGPLLVVVLKLAPTAVAESYRVQLTREGAASPIWTGSGLHRSPQNAIDLALPSRLVPPGRYRIDLDGMAPGRTERLASYRLKLVRTATH